MRPALVTQAPAATAALQLASYAPRPLKVDQIETLLRRGATFQGLEISVDGGR